MKVSIIVAHGLNREIGKDNGLLWHLPADMQFFKETTYWHHVIMGRKNYESIPSRFRPLVDRTNIIISRNPEYMAPECFVVGTLKEALDLAREYEEEEAFIIGGGEIYRLALQENAVDRMYITTVHRAYPEADTWFPEYEESEWEVSVLLDHPGDLTNVIPFTIRQFDRKKSAGG